MHGAPLSGLVESLAVLDRARRVLMGADGEVYITDDDLNELRTMVASIGDHPEEYLVSAQGVLTVYQRMLAMQEQSMPFRSGGYRSSTVDLYWLQVTTEIDFGGHLLLGLGVKGWGLSLKSGRQPPSPEFKLLAYWSAAIPVPEIDEIRRDRVTLLNVVAQLGGMDWTDAQISKLAAGAGMEINAGDLFREILGDTTLEDPYGLLALLRVKRGSSF